MRIPPTRWTRQCGPKADHERDRGASLVEFALVAPLLMLIVFGLFEFGLAIFRLQGMQAASRDAARIGAFPTVTYADIEARALASLEGTPLEVAPIITIEPATESPCASADEVIVEIRVDDPIAIPFFDDPSITLSTRAEFPCER